MSKPQARLLAAATFIVGFGLCIALFAVFDIDAIYLIGPGVVVAVGAFAAYHSARRDDPPSRGS
jgi:NADH:ubiquinone oxidoreductase subunit 3 (subunit A)